MKNIQDGDSHNRSISKAGDKLRRQQSRADLSSAADRFNRMSRTSSFAPSGVPRHLNSSSQLVGSGGGLGEKQGNIGGFSSNNLRSLSRTASVAGGGMSSRHGSKGPSTTFGFRGNPANMNGARVSSIAGEHSNHSKSMHTFKNRLGSSGGGGSIGGAQDLLSTYWSESRPRGQQQSPPTSRSSSKSMLKGHHHGSMNSFGRTASFSAKEGSEDKKIRSKSMVPTDSEL
jgi:hypothetical protein